MKESKINPIPDSVKAALKRTEAEILAFLDVGGGIVPNEQRNAPERILGQNGNRDEQG